MYICMLFVIASNLAYVTPSCFIDKTTMIEPGALTYVYDAGELPAIDLVHAPQVYVNYWRMFGAKSNGQWNPDKYVRISPDGLEIVHEPWRNPKVRVFHRHYEKHKEYLAQRPDPDAVARWQRSRSRHSESVNTRKSRDSRRQRKMRKQAPRHRAKRPFVKYSKGRRSFY